MKMYNIYIKIFLYIFIFAVAWGYIASYKMLHPPRFKPLTTPENYGLKFSELKLRTQDEVSISAWLIPSDKNKATIIVCHGYATGKADLLDVAKLLKEGGFNVLMIDFRAHAGSGGRVCSFGKKEIYDVKAAVDFIKSHHRLSKKPIGIFGLSMGGSIAYLSAARYNDIKAVISDGCYVYLDKTAKRYYKEASILPIPGFSNLLVWFSRIHPRLNLKTLSPINYIDKISPRPVFIIHGADDLLTPVSEVKEFYKHARHPKKIWINEEAQHAGIFFHSPELYQEKLVTFYEEALKID